MAYFKTFVQDSDGFNLDSLTDFIESEPEAKHLFVFSSLDDDFKTTDLVNILVQKLEFPFSGLKVSGFFVDGTYKSDVVGYMLLCGDIEVSCIQHPLEFHNIEECSSSLIKSIPESDLCFIWSANTYFDNPYLDSILRRVAFGHKDIQLIGGVSTPHPIVFSNEGIFPNSLMLTFVKEIQSKCRIYSGFKFEENSQTFTISDSDEIYVKEIDGEDPVKLFCGMKHVKPYFMNTIVSMAINKAMPELVSKLSKASQSISQALQKGTVEVFGFESLDRFIEAMYITNFDETNSKILTVGYRPKGLELRCVTTDPDSQIRVYKSIKKDFKDCNNVIAFPCGYLPFIYGCDHSLVEAELQNFENHAFVVYMWGEIGSKTPYKDGANIVHGSSIPVLGF